MNKNQEFWSLFSRYALLIILALGSLWVFYLVFTPLTIYPTYWLLNYFFGAALNTAESVIFVEGVPIEMIKACIAGSAYYLLLIFNLSTPNINISKRMKMIVGSFLIFLVINIIRIVLLTIMYINNSSFFDVTHKATWYIGSIIVVMAIWFYQVKAYKIKDIPFYSDLKFLYKHSLLRKRK